MRKRRTQDSPSALTRGEVNRAYAFACAARATLCEFAESNPDSVGDSGAQIAIELLNLIEDVLMENEGGTPAGRGFERSTASDKDDADTEGEA